jgi:DNA-binding response OmpR family regulator
MSTLIIVDDDRTNTKLVQMLLEMDGFKVIACPDSRRAKEAAAGRVDAFIIDCNLSQGEDGIDLLRAIRSGETGAPHTIPVVMTSGDDRRSSEAVENEANLFLLKPYSASYLAEELTQLLI